MVKRREFANEPLPLSARPRDYVDCEAEEVKPAVMEVGTKYALEKQWDHYSTLQGNVPKEIRRVITVESTALRMRSSELVGRLIAMAIDAGFIERIHVHRQIDVLEATYGEDWLSILQAVQEERLNCLAD